MMNNNSLIKFFQSQKTNENVINEKTTLLQSQNPDVVTVEGRSSTLSAGWNISNIILGIGILGLPYAMLKGSWLGIFMNIIAAFLCCSTGKIIVECLYEKKDHLNLQIRVHEDYPDIGEKVWPRFGRNFVIIISVVEMFGASTLYIILLGSSTYTLFRDMFPNLSEQYWYIICCGLVLPPLFIKDMALIARFSFIAVIGLSGTIVTTMIYCFTKYQDIKVNNVPRIFFPDLPISMGIIIFSYCAHPLLPAVEASMKRPEKFAKMINTSFFISAVTKIIFGIIPVLIFGKGTLQLIIDNFSINDYAFYVSTHIFILVNVFFSMPLVVYILSRKLDDIFLVNYFHNLFWPNERLHFLWIFLTRSIILSSILLTGLIVPYFALVMSFIGSFTGTCLTFVFPCWFSLSLQSKHLRWRQKAYRIGIIIFGTFFGANGMIFAAKEMIKISKL